MYTCIYTYKYTYVCTYMYTYICMHTYIHIYMCMHAYIHIYMYMYVYMHIHIYVYMCIRIYICVYIHVYTYMYIYVLMYAHMYVYMYILHEICSFYAIYAYFMHLCIFMYINMCAFLIYFSRCNTSILNKILNLNKLLNSSYFTQKVNILLKKPVNKAYNMLNMLHIYVHIYAYIALKYAKFSVKYTLFMHLSINILSLPI